MPAWPDGPLPRIERDRVDGYPNPEFFHACADGRVHRTLLPLGPDGWQWQDDGSLTPSIQCLECGTHGFWRGEAGWQAV